MNLPRTSLLLPLVAAALAGCSGSTKGSTTAEVQPRVAITDTNAVQAAACAWHAAFLPVRILKIATAFLELPSLIPTAGPGQPAPTPTQPIVNPEVQTVAGPEGGSAIRTWDDVDGDQRYSSGDRFTVAFSAWGESGLALDGVVVFRDLVITGDLIDGLSWRLDVQIDLIGIGCSVNGNDTTLNGSVAVHREKRATVRTMDVQLSQDLRLGVDVVQAGSTMARNEYVLDFTMGLFAEGRVFDPVLGGELEFAHDAPLTGLSVFADPMFGSFVVKGGGAAILTLVPTDMFNAELHFDADGDEVVEQVFPVEYASF
ncbi:MAG: hypothetical protein JNK15_14120 [Planctomycetes bacterium]|nr:hypothetical protein [Planctomycetota bacterium]